MAIRRGTAGDDTLIGTRADDLLVGLAGKDRLLGGAGRDTINAGAGDDVLDGGAGLDKLRGEAGNDTYVIDDAREIDRSLADAGIDLVRSKVSYTLGANQENLQLLGSANLIGSGNAGANIITGNSGANLLSGGAGADRLLGGGGNDTLVFDTRDLTIDGGLGVDTLRVTGTGKTLTASLLVKVHHVEVVDLRGSGANSLTLDKSLVAALSGGTVLRVLANEDDTIALSGSWLRAGSVKIGGVDFERYYDGRTRVDIEHGATIDNSHVIALGQLTGTDGFRIDGVDASNLLGISIAGAGDVNGDGLADLIVNGGINFIGSANRDAYVLFGRDSGFAASFSVSELSSAQGFRIEQSVSEDQGDTHRAVLVAGAGDINGDGLADVFVTNVNGLELADETAYVVFGSSQTLSTTVDASTMDGSAGLRIHGLHKGWQYFQSHGAGDINGDGFSDLVIGDRFAGSIGANGVQSGSTYVVFGHAGVFNADIDVAALNGSDGLRLDGPPGTTTGRNVSAAGDLNGDGISDLLLDGKYVVFGNRSDWPANFDLSSLDGHNGFAIERGSTLDGTFPSSVAADGDFNGDGIDDLLITNVESFSTPGGGAAHYVLLYGHRGDFAASVPLPAAGSGERFHLGGSGTDEYSGWTARFAGDIDGDGYDDVIFGAPGGDVAGQNAGGAYVVFGHGGVPDAVIELDQLQAQQGFRLDGVAALDRAGYAVGAAGDINGDGFDDLFVGAGFADNNVTYSGSAYVLLGRDFRTSADFVGGDGDDSFTGGSAAEILISGRGNDLLAGGGGNDVLKGGAGDDVLVFDSTDTLAVEGDAGLDTLRIDGAGVTLDLSLAINQHFDGVERIDLTGSGANTLVLDVHAILSLPDHFDTFVTNHTSQLLVTGNADDRVTLLGDGWLHDPATVDVDGTQYQSYTHGGAAVQVLLHPDLLQPAVV